MTIEQALLYIENHGLAIVALVIVAYWLTKVVNWFSPFVEKMLNKTMEKDGELMEASRYLSLMEASTAIDGILDDIRNEIDADRVFIWEYHNRGKSITGAEFIRFTMTHEVVGKGVRRIIHEMQSLPVSLVALWTKELVKMNTVCVPDVAALENADASTYYMLADRGVLSAYRLPLDENGIVFGALGIEFTREKVNLDCDKKDIVKNYAARISGFYEQTRFAHKKV